MKRGTGRFQRLFRSLLSRYNSILTRRCPLPRRHERRWRKTSINALGLRPGDRILEMGCGWGATTFILAEYVAGNSRVEAIDTSPGKMGVAGARRRFPNIDFLAMDAAETGFRGATFDKVVIAHLIYRLQRNKRLAVLREARRVLTEGGRVGVVELDWPSSPLMRLYFNVWWWSWRPWRFQQATRRDMLRHGIAEELREAGFGRVRKVRLYHGGIQVVTGEKPGAERAGGARAGGLER